MDSVKVLCECLLEDVELLTCSHESCHYRDDLGNLRNVALDKQKMCGKFHINLKTYFHMAKSEKARLSKVKDYSEENFNAAEIRDRLEHPYLSEDYWLYLRKDNLERRLFEESTARGMALEIEMYRDDLVQKYSNCFPDVIIPKSR